MLKQGSEGLLLIRALSFLLLVVGDSGGPGLELMRCPGHLGLRAFTNFFESLSQYLQNWYGYIRES